MPYIVTNSDGSSTITVADSVVDTSTYSLALVGRNVSNYGQYFAQNTIRHLENFASSTAPSPSTRLIGQLWYDKSESILRVWDGSNWKRATGTLVGPVGSRPTSALGGGGTQFFNTTTSKLEVYNGSKFAEASYPGEITTASSDPDGPSLHGSRLRSIFLTDIAGRKHPVIALSYVKSSGSNQGSTQIGTGGQYETIMALFADEQFTVDNVASVVDGVSVNYYSELTGTGGIASVRSSRASAVILPGMNIRAEYESDSVSEIENLYANTIGSSSNPVSSIDVNEIQINNQLTINDSANITNNLNLGGTATIGGDVIATSGVGRFANIVVTAGSVLNGDTTINGNLTLNGVNTQSLGTDSEKVETIFGDAIDTQSIVVDGVATINDVQSTEITASANITTVDLTATGNTGLQSTEVTSLTATGAVDFDTTLNVDGVATFQDAINAVGQTITASVFNGAVQQVNVTLNSDNATKYVVFADSTGAQDITADAGLTYNPSTNQLNVGTLNLTGGFTATSATFSGDVDLGNDTGDTVTITGRVDSTISPTVNDTYDLGASGRRWATVWGTTFNGVATSAQYADLAEIYASDEQYEPGTVVKLGGSAEITKTESHADTEVFGVISTDPAYLMNSEAEGLPVALTGRVPVKVIGKIKKGERLVSSDVPGVAWALGEDEYDTRAVIGRSLENKDDGDAGIIEAVIGVK